MIHLRRRSCGITAAVLQIFCANNTKQTQQTGGFPNAPNILGSAQNSFVSAGAVMRTDTGHVFRLEDYRPSDFLIRSTALDFQLEPDNTIIKATLVIERCVTTLLTAPLVLDGDELTLISLQINGLPAHDFEVTPDVLYRRIMFLRWRLSPASILQPIVS
jgi:hypothetical protein